MKLVILLLFFICSLVLVYGILYFFTMRNSRVERRVKYYLDIDKKYQKMKKNAKNEKPEFSNLKNINQFVGDKISDESQDRIGQMLKSSGVDMDVEEYIMMLLLASIFSGLVCWLIFRHFLFAIPGAVIGYVIPRFWVKRKRKKRIQAFNDGLPDMILTVVGSLRAGYSFTQAMKTVAEECESPIKEEVTMLLKEMSYGVTMEDALNNFKLRMPSNDLDLMIQAILIQRQVGGNLSMILEIIVKTIRERNSIERQVQALTAQGRLSGLVVGLLPIVLLVALYLLNPSYIKSFAEEMVGKIALGVGLVFGIIGFIIMNKLTKIEV